MSLKKIFYQKWVGFILKSVMSLFYDKKYLCGKYFDEHRMGYVWCWRDLPGRLFGKNRHIPWPVNKFSMVSGADKISFHPDSILAFQNPGCYFQCHNATIRLGRDVNIAPNCGLITTNHDINDPSKHALGKDIVIGDYCWVGMNAVILPGVELGAHTVVGAGSVVTHSFPEGYLVIAGNPARIIKHIVPNSRDKE